VAVLFDTSALLLGLHPEAKPPVDPATGQPLEYAKQRVTYLIKSLSKARTKVIVPAPVLTEMLIGAGSAANEYITNLQQSPFRVAPFDTRAAIECADLMARNATRAKAPANPRAKIKFDHQIVAIAKVEQVETIYSDDKDIHALASRAGISVVRSFELQLDPAERQLSLLPREPDGHTKVQEPKS